MPNILLLSESDLRTCAPLDLAAVDCIEDAFAQLAIVGVIMPPVLRLNIDAQRGEVDVKTAYDITLCDLIGTGVQDTAMAELARVRAVQTGIGTPLNA